MTDDCIHVGQFQYKLNAQSLRIFGLHSNDDVKDAHRAGANPLKKKKVRENAAVACNGSLRASSITFHTSSFKVF